MKKCPYCTEEIRDEAVKCRYCGEWLDKIRTGQTDEYADGSHSRDVTDKVKLNNETPTTSSENNFHHTDAVNADIAFDDSEKTMEEKLVLSNTVEDHFKKLKRAILLLYVGFLPVVFIGYLLSTISGSLADIIIIIGFFALILYYWFYLLLCAQDVGKNPLFWILISTFLNLIGPIFAYHRLKKSAEGRVILKPKKT